MTSVDTRIQAFLPILLEAWPFKYLSASLQQQLSARVQVCSFQVGELIHPSGELPSTVHCVVQERVRILGPDTHQSPTLAVLGRGAVVGWDSLLRRTPTGSVRAALESAEMDQPILTLALSADDFEFLAVRHLMPVLLQRLSLGELFDTLSRFLATQPTRPADLNLKEIVQYIEREQLATVQIWTPPPTNGNGRRSSVEPPPN